MRNHPSLTERSCSCCNYAAKIILLLYILYPCYWNSLKDKSCPLFSSVVQLPKGRQGTGGTSWKTWSSFPWRAHSACVGVYCVVGSDQGASWRWRRKVHDHVVLPFPCRRDSLALCCLGEELLPSLPLSYPLLFGNGHCTAEWDEPCLALGLCWSWRVVVVHTGDLASRQIPTPCLPVGLGPLLKVGR